MQSRLPPLPPPPGRAGRFRQVPPAIFPPILGLLGLGLAWRRGADAFGVPPGAVELFLGGFSLLFLFAAVTYGAKLVLRAGVWREDLRVLPGRTGLAAMTMGAMALAAALAPYAPGPALWLLLAAFAGHLATALAVIVGLVRRPGEMGPLTPAMLLVFAGFIVAPTAALPLGIAPGVVAAIVWFSLAASVAISAPTLAPLLTGRAPPPLRPLQAIHLAPVALAASAAFDLGIERLGLAALGGASVLFALLLFRLRWMTAAGFSGFWSAFTFPLAAYAGALIAAWQVYGGEALRLGGGIVLVLATLVIPPIALRVLRMWAEGGLAAKTNAAIA